MSGKFIRLSAYFFLLLIVQFLFTVFAARVFYLILIHTFLYTCKGLGVLMNDLKILLIFFQKGSASDSFDLIYWIVVIKSKSAVQKVKYQIQCIHVIGFFFSTFIQLKIKKKKLSISLKEVNQFYND